MRFCNHLLSVSSLFVGSVLACTPDFQMKQVFVFNSGSWSASPILAGSSIMTTASNAWPFVVQPMTAFNANAAPENVVIRTGNLSVSGASGVLQLQTFNVNDTLQQYSIDCTECNYLGGSGNARGCSLKPASNSTICITNFGINEEVAAIPCSQRAAGQYWHFNETMAEEE
jgi:hypothetical protein